MCCFQHLTQFCCCTRAFIVAFSFIKMSHVFHGCVTFSIVALAVKKHSVQSLSDWTCKLWTELVQEMPWWNLWCVAVQESWVGQDSYKLLHRQSGAFAGSGRCGAGCWRWGPKLLAWDWPCVLHMTLLIGLATLWHAAGQLWNHYLARKHILSRILQLIELCHMCDQMRSQTERDFYTSETF